jgi:hypothetical protein
VSYGYAFDVLVMAGVYNLTVATSAVLACGDYDAVRNLVHGRFRRQVFGHAHRVLWQRDFHGIA